MFENIGKKGPAIPFIPQLLKRREKEEGGVERTHATLLPKSNHASSAHHGSTSHRQTDGWERLGKGDPKKETLKKQVWAPPYSFFTEERDQNRDVVAALPVWDRAIFVSPEEKGWSCHNSQRGMVWLQRVRELTADYQCVFHLCQLSNQNVLPCSSTRPSNPPPTHLPKSIPNSSHCSCRGISILVLSQYLHTTHCTPREKEVPWFFY